MTIDDSFYLLIAMCWHYSKPFPELTYLIYLKKGGETSFY